MPASRRILLLTADPVLGQLLARQLGQDGEFDVAVAVAPTAGESPEAVLLDASLAPGPAPNRRLIADRLPGRPVLVLGGEACGPEEAAGTLPKPVRVPELAQRLRALLAGFDASPGAAVPIGPFSFHAASRTLHAGPVRIRLTETEAAILAYLHRAGGRAVPREELLGEVWGYSAAVATHTLETHVYRLRRKLGQDGPLLRREPGGYRLADRRGADQSGPS